MKSANLLVFMIQIKSAKKPGFTLLELLVVIFIIAIISTLAYISLESSRAKSRDTRRLADVYQIRQALELYRETEGSYPASLPSPQQALVGDKSGKAYLTPMPCDPKTRLPYAYSLAATGGYRLTFNLERDNLDYPAGENILTPLGYDETTGN